MPLTINSWLTARKALTSTFSHVPEVAFVQALLDATGGAPPLVLALAEDMAASGVAPESANASAVGITGGPQLARAVDQFADSLDPELLPAALLLSIAAGTVPYEHLAGLTGMPQDALDRCARVLAERGLVDDEAPPTRFRHAPARRRLAARLLDRLVEPARWPTVQTWLLSLYEGPDGSAPHPPEPHVLARLRAAARLRLDAPSRLLLAEQLCWAGQSEAALSLLRDPLPSGADAATFHGLRTLIRCFFPGQDGVPAAPTAGTWNGIGDTPPLTVAAEALTAALAGMPAYEVAPRAERVLSVVELGPGTFQCVLSAVWALLYADRLESAAAWSRRLAQQARRGGGSAWQSVFLTIQATVERQLGSLKASARHNALALELAAEEFSTSPWRLVIEWSRLVASLLHDTEVVDRVAVEPPTTSVLWVYHRYARGRVHLADKRHDEAHADFMACGDALRSWKMDNPTVVPWRSGAALALAALGDRPAGLALALEEVRLARACAAPRALGISLRSAAALADPPFRLDLLRESALVHEAAGARLELAYTLRDVGVEHLRSGEQQQGRATLTTALQLAEQCADAELGTQIRDHLADGAPGEGTSHRTAATALTASQKRVALLARAGRSNRDIAGELFLTVSTVEQHLTQIYRKLGISRRIELARLPAELLTPPG
ncbi:helix-turn-helix transcriptional regulator [Streptantibioticus cattleyicolor]|uniref:Transcriptional regulator n=1 Tax=Streptantibioticus cattleyicolor (strain ATCC 35852 / DSM 46488 / JCM 4925 / NBRC 14057 / NRRL 8057) TaxID=1003195 RepID=F8JL93_STREN|nr:LuxR C-terminal-related transcriptional regulator [Streptantibioticus cattleyicolor]AEW99621.1 transcriptional regulator [Streptantibioticus cattleyicolor NRRL 8057 = DSM 46488]CCB71342.1 putative regulator [Streptantibioticus cattleyicolor NRRL 8057 = DSM 46488]